MKISMGNLQRDHLFVPPLCCCHHPPLWASLCSQVGQTLYQDLHSPSLCSEPYVQDPLKLPRLLPAQASDKDPEQPGGALPAFVTFHISPFVFFIELVTTCHLKTITSCLGLLFVYFFSFFSKPYEPETEYICLRLASAPLKDKCLLNESRRSEGRRSWVSPDSSWKNWVF